jgi:glycosyltransferase involved in cell wall biosynthesis
VSHSVAQALRERAPGLARTRIDVVPNGVDVSAVRAQVDAAPRPMSEPYVLFVGKLAKNKGVSALVSAAGRARLEMPLVVIGDGPERASLEQQAAAAGRDVRMLGWLDRREVFLWLRHAGLLMFPSTWPEPLSRVLIEASALGVPIAAMNTGGTPDIILDEETGLLSSSVDGLSHDVARLASDAALGARLGAGARKRAETLFDLPIVIQRMESLYRELASTSGTRNRNAIA